MMGFRTKIRFARQGQEIDWDSHGNPIYGPSVDVTYWGEIQPLSSVEKGPISAQATVTLQKVYLPAHAALSGADRVTIDGRTYELTGDPERHMVGGHVHHQTVVVKHVT